MRVADAPAKKRQPQEYVRSSVYHFRTPRQHHQDFFKVLWRRETISPIAKAGKSALQNTRGRSNAEQKPRAGQVAGCHYPLGGPSEVKASRQGAKVTGVLHARSPKRVTPDQRSTFLPVCGHH